MTATQPELPIAEAAAMADPSIDLVVSLLHAEPGWLTAAQILTQLGEPVHEAAKRKLRDLANHSAGNLISGQKGYRHIRHASPDEIAHAAHWLRHQAKAMDDRATDILKRYHSLPHSPKP
jgi:hypothetical protein